MAARALVLYNTPTDPQAFNDHFFSTHVPLVKQYPNLRSFTVSEGAVSTPRGESPYHLVAEMAFDSLADLQAAFSSQAGAASARDLRNFAGAGATILMYETREA